MSMSSRVTTGPITRRLLQAYYASSDAEREAGRAWYDEARDYAIALASGSPYTVQQAAEVIAVVSAGNKWATNKRDAATIFTAHAAGCEPDDVKVSTYGTNKRKAWRILSGESALSGPKVVAFARAILGDDEAITLDRWALRAAVGADVVGEPLRRACLRAYANAARSVGETPRDIQAIVWVHVRALSD